MTYDKRDMQWYIVECETVSPAKYRIKARDAIDAMARCFDDGEEIKMIDFSESTALAAYLEKDQGSDRACPVCKGKGEISVKGPKSLGYYGECPHCRGDGYA